MNLRRKIGSVCGWIILAFVFACFLVAYSLSLVLVHAILGQWGVGAVIVLSLLWVGAYWGGFGEE